MTGRPLKYDAGFLDRMAEFWALNLTTAEIGRRFGVSKNSICRLARDTRIRGDLRFPERRGPGAWRAPKPKPKPEAVSAPSKPKSEPKPRKIRSVSAPPKPELREPHPTIYQLRPHECRYPVTTGADHRHRFCAGRRRPGSPYCEEHFQLCRAPRAPLRRAV